MTSPAGVEVITEPSAVAPDPRRKVWTMMRVSLTILRLIVASGATALGSVIVMGPGFKLTHHWLEGGHAPPLLLPRNSMAIGRYARCSVKRSKTFGGHGKV